MSLAAPFKNLVFLALLCIISTAAMAQKKTYELWAAPDRPEQLVLDDAELLKTETVTRLKDMVQRHQDSTGIQVGVLVIYDLSGPIDSYARKVMAEWKLGYANKDGAIILIVQKSREVRIEVGKGLIDRLTPDEGRRIIYNEIVPAFKEKEYDKGAIAGIKAMLVAIDGTYKEKTSSFDVPFWMAIASTIIIIAASIGLFSKYYSGAFYGGLLPFFAVTMGLFISWWGVAIFAVAFPILRFLIVKSGMEQLTFGKNATGGNREEDEYDRINSRNTIFGSSSSDSSSSSSSSSSDSSGSSGSW